MAETAVPAAPLSSVKLRAVPPMQGALWVKNGLRAFFRQPLGFAGLYGTVMFVGMLLMSLQVVGLIAVITFTPAITLAFMRAVQYTLSGRRFGIMVLVDVWRSSPERRLAQLKLGLLYCACVGLVLLVLGTLLSGTPSWQQALDGSDAAREAALQSPALLRAVLLGMLAYVPISIAFWHAPALVQWAGQPVAKSIFFSLMACWHNRWAFTVFGLTWGGVIFLAASLSAMLATLFQSPQALQFVTLPIAIVFGASFYASIYFSVVDCFEHRPADPPG